LKTISKFLLLSILLSVVYHGKVSAFYWKLYNTSNLLASNNVYFVYKDSNGYLWFLTDKGVSKFDGEKFKNFSLPDGLGDNEVFKAFEDKQGRLWLFTHDGSPCYIFNDHVYNAGNSPLLKQLPLLPYINEIYQDNDLSLYIGYKSGEVLKIQGENVKWICRRDQNGHGVNSIYKTNDSVRIVFSDKIVYLKNDVIVKVSNLQENVSFFQDSNLLVVDKEGIKIYRNDSLFWKTDDPLLNINTTVRLYLDREGDLFCCTNSGLITINIKSGARWELFPNIHITCVTKDISGNYWITTLHNGIYFINGNLDEIKLIGNMETYDIIHVKNGQMFFKKKNNVYTLTKVKNEYRIDKIYVPFKSFYEPLYLDDSFFFYSNPKAKGQTYYFDRKRNKASILPIYIKYIWPYGKNDFLLVGFSSLYDCEIVGGVIKIKNVIHSTDSRLSTPLVNDLNNFYCIKRNALYEYNTVSSQFKKVDSFSSDISIVNISCVDENIILKTNDDRTIIYRQSDGYLKKYLSQSDVFIFDLYKLNNGSDLLSTNKGYFISDSGFTDAHFTDHFRKPVFPFKQNDLLFLYPYNGKVICNVNGNLYVFDQKLLNIVRDTPRIFIKKIIAKGKEYTNNDITLSNVTDCNLNIELSSLYFNNERNDFEYRIVSGALAGQWYVQQSGNLNILLNQCGTYRIDIRAITEGGAISPTQSIKLVLLPPFYYTHAFYACVIILLMLAFVYFSYRYAKKRKKIFENELTYLQLENKAINSLMNPHFIFNAINNIQGLVNTGHKGNASNYLAVLSKLIRQNIENLQFNFISVEKELELLRNYIHLQNLRFDNKINLDIQNNLESTENIKIPPLLIHTFVENSIVHGFKREMDNYNINVDLDLSSDDYLIIKITDNGIGINNNNRSFSILRNQTSLGISFTQKRLKRLSLFYKVDHSLTVKDLRDRGKNGTEIVIIIYAKFKELN